MVFCGFKKCILYNSFNNSYYLGGGEGEFGFCLQFHISHNLAYISDFCGHLCLYVCGGGGVFYVYSLY